MIHQGIGQGVALPSVSFHGLSQLNGKPGCVQVLRVIIPPYPPHAKILIQEGQVQKQARSIFFYSGLHSAISAFALTLIVSS